MSIYDEPNTPQSTEASPAESPTPSQPPAKKKRSGCATCLIMCLGMMFVCVVACGVGGWFVMKKAPDWARDAVVATIEGSDLTEADKQIVTQQVDRVITEYKAGRISMEQLGQIAEEFSESPLPTLMMAMAAEEAYIKSSGLEQAEKEQAKRTLQRVARGVFEEHIESDELNTALDYVSTQDANGARQFNHPVADEERRNMLAECKRLADDSNVPDEDYKVNVGEQLKAAIDRALATNPMEGFDLQSSNQSLEAMPATFSG